MSSTLPHPRPAGRAGFTVIEIVVAIAILGVLASIAGTQYARFLEKARVANAIVDIKNIATEIESFLITKEKMPVDLAEVGYESFLDPWERPYRYLAIEGVDKNMQGQARKDRFLVPINSDFDLYSVGRDGESQLPLVVKVSHDDVLRANDGGYIGLAKHY